MARYNHLGVYKSTYDLNLYFFKLAQGFPKDYKYGLAGEVKALLCEVLDQVIIANSSANKTAAIQRASLDIERIRFKSRMLHDLKVMSIKSYEYFSRQLVDISKQFEKWYSWAKDNNTA